MSGEWSSVDRINEIIRAINERSLVVFWSDSGQLDLIEAGEDLQDPVFWSNLQSRAHQLLQVSLDPIDGLQSQTVMPLATTPINNGAYHLAGLNRHGWTRRYPRTLGRAFNGDLVGLGRGDGPATVGVVVAEQTNFGLRRFIGVSAPVGFGSESIDEGEPPLIFWDGIFSGAPTPTWPLEGWRARLEPDNVFYDRINGEWVVSDDQQSPPDLVETFGEMRANDYVGPWIVEELEAVLRACAGRSYQLRTFGEAAGSLDWTIQAITFSAPTVAEVYQEALASLIESHSVGTSSSGLPRYNRFAYGQQAFSSARAAVQSGGIAATTEPHPPGLPAIQSIQAFTTLFERSPTGPGGTLRTETSDLLEWFGSANIPAGSIDSVSLQSNDFSETPNPLPAQIPGAGEFDSFSSPDLFGSISSNVLRAIGAPQFQHLT